MKTVLARRLISLMLAGGLMVGAAMTASAQVEVDFALPGYERTSGVSGNLNSIGSDTLNNLMTLWAEAFRAIYPNVNIQIEGKGSSTAPPGADRRHRATGSHEPPDEVLGTRTGSSRNSATSRRRCGWPSMPWRCSCTRTIRRKV